MSLESPDNENLQISEKPKNFTDNNPETIADNKKRKQFASNFECVITAIATAVGLGNVWRFPYLCYRNGGGAFFVPYLIILILAAMPLLALEMSWGQFTSVGPLQSWNCYPLLGGVGLAAVMSSFLMVTFYNVLGAYAIFYLAMSFYSLKSFNDPIWNGCNETWNTDNCMELNKIKQLSNMSLHKSSFNLPTEEFWIKFVSHDSGSIRDFGYPHWEMVICLFVTCGIVLVCLYRSVETLGKASYFFAIYPYFCVTFLTIGGLFQDGAAEGLLTYLIPKLDRLLNFQVWADAGQQIFFSLGVGQGLFTVLSSFNSFHQQAYLNSVIIVLVNCITSFWVGMPIFMVIGNMAYVTGTTVDKVMDDGPALAFIVYPQALSLLPGAVIWSIVFCSMLLTIALGSAASLTETVITQIADSSSQLQKNKREFIFRGLFIIGLFLLGLPLICSGGFHLLEILNGYSTGVNSFIAGILEFLGISYLYGYDKYERDMITMVGHKPGKYWKYTWKYLGPLVLFFMGILWIINIAQLQPTEPYWTTSLGWAINMSCNILIPLYALYAMCQQPSGLSSTSYKALTKPNEEWILLEKSRKVLQDEAPENEVEDHIDI